MKLKETAIVIILVLSSLLLSCSSAKVEKENHIHALAFDPSEPGTFYAGTHYYLEKHTPSGPVEEVGPYGNDYMGFVISKDGTFYSSGHSLQIPNIGIRKSTDKGKTWEILAYEGLDFHDMAVSYADPNLIYAWSTPPENKLLVSKDAGKTWSDVSASFPAALYSLAADHQQPHRVYAGSLTGLSISDNFGRTWNKNNILANMTVLAIADDPAGEGKMYLSTYQRGILLTEDDGKNWQEMNGGLDFSKEPLLILTIDPNTKEVYGVTRDDSIYKYEGDSWTKMKEGE